MSADLTTPRRLWRGPALGLVAFAFACTLTAAVRDDCVVALSARPRLDVRATLRAWLSGRFERVTTRSGDTIDFATYPDGSRRLIAGPTRMPAETGPLAFGAAVDLGDAGAAGSPASRAVSGDCMWDGETLRIGGDALLATRDATPRWALVPLPGHVVALIRDPGGLEPDARLFEVLAHDVVAGELVLRRIPVRTVPRGLPRGASESK